MFRRPLDLLAFGLDPKILFAESYASLQRPPRTEVVNENPFPLRFLALFRRRDAQAAVLLGLNSIIFLVRKKLCHSILYGKIRHSRSRPLAKWHNLLERGVKGNKYTFWDMFGICLYSHVIPHRGAALKSSS